MGTITKNHLKRVLVMLMAFMMTVTMMPVGSMGSLLAYADEAVATANVTVRAQSHGAFVSGFDKALKVSADAAENMGYTDSVKNDVSALDALVEAHKSIFGDSFTKEKKGDFLTVSSAGYVEKIFGEETDANGFMLNEGYPNSGENWFGSGYMGTTVATQAVKTGDVLDFFVYQDQDAYTDQYTLVKAPEKAVTGSTLDVTVKGVSAMAAYLFGTPEELAGGASPLKDMPLVWVDGATGKTTAIEGAVTDESGKARIKTPETEGTYYIAAASSKNVYSIMTTAKVVVTAPIKAEGITVKCEDSYTAKLGSSTYNYVLGSEKKKTFKLDATVSPEGAAQDVVWTSNNSNFKINDEGVVTMPENMSGNAYVTFTAKVKSDNSLSAQFTTYILPPLSIPSAYQNMVLTIPEDGVVINNDKYIMVSPQDYQQRGFAKWTVWDSSIVRIDQDSNSNICYVNPEKAGTTTIAVVDIDGNAAKTKITVKGFFVKDAKGNSGKGECQVGEKYQLTAETEDKVTWTSSNEAVATVDENGLVDTHKTGVVKLTAESDNGKCSYELTVKKSDELYLDTLWTTSSSSLYTDEEMKTSLPTEKKLINVTDSYTTTAHFFDVTQKAFPVMYAKQGTSNTSVSFGAKFDTAKFKAEVVQDGKVISTYQSGKTQSITIKAGTNKFAIRLTSLENKKQFTDYEFTIERELSTNEALSTMSVTPENRKPQTLTKYRGENEGTLLRADENGNITSGKNFTASVLNYKVFLYSDVEKFVANLKTTNAVNGHLEYSYNDGKDWTDVQCNTNAAIVTEAKAFEENKGKIMIRVTSDSNYAKAKAEGKDPYENSKTYTVFVERISDKELDGLKLLSMKYSEGCKDATPSFNPDVPWAAATVSRDTDKITLTFTAPEGSNVFKTSISTANKLTPASTKDGVETYTLDVSTPLESSTKTYTQKLLLARYDEAGKVVGQNEYTVSLLKLGTKAGIVKGLPDDITGYLCPGSQYSVNGQSMYGGYGLYPEKTLQGGASWNTAVSLGNFGGYATYYYKDGIKDDPTHKYGIDFTVFGNSNGGQSFSEPGAAYVSEDGKTWYTLAGSEHYEDSTLWDYQVTYINKGGNTADYKDNLGNSGSLGAAFAPLLFPESKIYPTAKENYSEDENEVTVSGVRLYSPASTSTKGLGLETVSAAAFPAFGYFDVHKNSKMVGTSGDNVTLLEAPLGNPYVKDYENYGDGFDLKWAVDEKGMPVDVSGKEFHYVKLQTASFINAGVFGEKSAEVNGLAKADKGEANVGKSTAPKTIEISDGKTVKTVDIEDGKQIYDVNLDGMKYVSIDVKGAKEDANIYVNNQRLEGNAATGIKVTKDSEKLVRVIVQDGEAEPEIYMLKLNSQAENTVIDGVKAEVNGAITLAESKDGENYAMTVPANAEDVKLMVETADSTKLTVNGDEFKNGANINLEEGENSFVIEGTNKSDKQTVNLIITKKSPNADADGIKVTFTLMGDSLHDSDADGTEHTLAGENLTTWIEKETYTVPAGSTVLDVFSKALKEKGYKWTNKGGNYISAITTPDGVELGEFSNGLNSGWMYVLNGKHPDLGLAEQTIKSGDDIVWHYTDNYKSEEWDDPDAPQTPEAQMKELLEKTKLSVTTAKTKKKNVKVTVKSTKSLESTIKELKNLGYGVKFKFYRSLKTNAGYKKMLVTKGRTYTNTKGVKGETYYYKVRLAVYDKDGHYVSETALKQCAYSAKTWTKKTKIK